MGVGLQFASESFQTALDAAVVNVAADLDTDAADEGWVLSQDEIQAGAVTTGQVVLQGLPGGVGEGGGAFDAGGAAGDFQAGQTLKMGQNGDVAARLDLDDLGDGGADTGFIQGVVDHANTE